MATKPNTSKKPKLTPETPTEQAFVHDETDYTRVESLNLVPASLPKKQQVCAVLIEACAFGMRDVSKQKAFAQLFHDQVVSAWGNQTIDLKVDTIEADRRFLLLKKCINNFFASYTSVPDIWRVEVIEGFAGMVQARYQPEYHTILFNQGYITDPMNAITSVEFARALYHEMRHAEQCQFITRFMEARGQKMAGTEGAMDGHYIFSEDPYNQGRERNPKYPFSIKLWQNVEKANSEDKNCVQEIKKGHPYYGCVVRWYAGNFGRLADEKGYSPNIYEDKDYPIDPQKMSADSIEAVEKGIDLASQEVQAASKALQQDPNNKELQERSKLADERYRNAKYAKEKSYRMDRPMEKDAFVCGDAVAVLYDQTYGGVKPKGR